MAQKTDLKYAQLYYSEVAVVETAQLAVKKAINDSEKSRMILDDALDELDMLFNKDKNDPIFLQAKRKVKIAQNINKIMYDKTLEAIDIYNKVTRRVNKILDVAYKESMNSS